MVKKGYRPYALTSSRRHVGGTFSAMSLFTLPDLLTVHGLHGLQRACVRIILYSQREGAIMRCMCVICISVYSSAVVCIKCLCVSDRVCVFDKTAMFDAHDTSMSTKIQCFVDRVIKYYFWKSQGYISSKTTNKDKAIAIKKALTVIVPKSTLYKRVLCTHAWHSAHWHMFWQLRLRIIPMTPKGSRNLEDYDVICIRSGLLQSLHC